MDKFVFIQDTVHVDWPRWLLRFENFLIVSDINATNEPAKALSLLLHVGGDKLFDIHTSAQTNPIFTYKTFIAFLNARFAAQNTHLATVIFRSTAQLPEEELEDYVIRLQMLAKVANTPADNISEEILRIITTHAYDESTIGKSVESDMTLDKLLKWRKGEDVKLKCLANSKQAKAAASILNINFNKSQNNAFASNETKNNSNKCNSCGYDYPHVKQCPAKGAECHKCHKLNHFSRVCRSIPNNTNNQRQSNSRSSNINPRSSYNNNDRQQNNRFKDNNRVRQIHELSVEEQLDLFEKWYKTETAKEQNHTHKTEIDEDEDIMSIREEHGDPSAIAINEMTTQELLDCPRTFIQLGSNKIKHLVDTGTNLNIISASTYNSLSNRPLLRKTLVNAYGFNSHTKIPLKGEFTTTIKFRHKPIKARYLVLDGEATNIIGFTTAI